MEEYIKVLKGFLNTKILYGRMALTSSQVDIVKHAIRSLINKYKEKEKIIELMAQDIAHNGFDEDICRAFKQEERSWECNDDRNCERCIIEYYKKKAKGE